MNVVRSQSLEVSKRVCGFMLCAMLFALCGFASAQQPKKVPRVGMLITGSPSTHKNRIDAFHQGLQDLGYIEGKNITIEYRYAEGKSERYSELAAEMVRSKPDVIVVGSTGFTGAAKKATSTIPIVVGGAGDLVGTGLVASLAKPGGNITGSTETSPDLSGKRLELLKEVISKGAHRVAVFWANFPSTSDEDEVKQTEIAARLLGMRIQSVGVQGPNEFEDAYKEMTKQHADALIIIQGSLTNFHRRRLADLAIKKRLPTMCENSSWAEEGCLLSYGPNQLDEWRRAATYVDKILKGAKPADLPVEQPKKFEFVINLKAAKQIGLTVPPNVLARADRVIK